MAVAWAIGIDLGEANGPGGAEDGTLRPWCVWAVSGVPMRPDPWNATPRGGGFGAGASPPPRDILIILGVIMGLTLLFRKLGRR